jgi:hypothetical protein
MGAHLKKWKLIGTEHYNSYNAVLEVKEVGQFGRRQKFVNGEE